MYTQQDYQQILAQQKRCRIAFAVGNALFFACVLLGLVYRQKPMAYVMGGLWAVGLVAVSSLVLSPVKKYRRHMEEALHGQRRQAHVVFDAMAARATIRDGLDVVEMHFFDEDNEGRERVLYWDAQRPVPDWQPQDRLLLTTHDLFIIDFKPL